jgi:hypothetical protein
MSLKLRYDKHGNAVGACPLDGGIVRCPYAVADCADCKIGNTGAGGATGTNNADQLGIYPLQPAPTPPVSAVCGEDCPIAFGVGCDVCPHYSQNAHTHSTHI